MRWPWQLREDRRADHARADAALEISREQRAKGSRQAAEAKQRAVRWRRWQERNHFAEGFRRALEEGR